MRAQPSWGAFPIEAEARARCADAYDAEPAREPSPTPAPPRVVLICHSTLATLHISSPGQPHHPVSMGGFRPVHGGHSGGLLFVLFLFRLSGPYRTLGDITGSRHGPLMKTLAADQGKPASQASRISGNISLPNEDLTPVAPPT